MGGMLLEDAAPEEGQGESEELGASNKTVSRRIHRATSTTEKHDQDFEDTKDSRLFSEKLGELVAAQATQGNDRLLHLESSKLGFGAQRPLSIASTISESAFLPSFTLSTTSYLTKPGAAAKTPTLSLSFRQISIESLADAFESTDVRQRLALMLRLPWGASGLPADMASTLHASTASSLLLGSPLSSQSLARKSIFISSLGLGLGLGLGVATISCLGGFCIARLVLPRVKIFVVCLRRSLARLCAAHQLGLQTSLRAAVLLVREPRSIEPVPGEPGQGSSTNLITAKQQEQNNFTTPLHQSTLLQHDYLADSPDSLYRSPDIFRGGRRGWCPEQNPSSTPTAADLADDELDEELRDVMTEESIWSRRASPRRMTINQPVNVDDILAAGGPNSPVRPVPLERIGDSPLTFNAPSSATLTNNDFIMSPSRDRSSSTSDKLSKRLSLNFPVQPASARPSRPPSWSTSPLISPEVIASPTEGNFLTVLAHQERRVLELKEELRRAEEELERLKKHWANREMYKKRHEVRRGQPLEPLRTNLPAANTSDDDVDGTQQWLQREMDRRKALVSGTRSSGRKVFSGSRHTRTLSLLSPDKGTVSEPFPQNSPPKKPSIRTPAPRSALDQPSASPHIRNGLFSPTKDDIFGEMVSTNRDAMVKTGKQMASDIKEGLWTFFEDIRQATVGDEATPARTSNAINNISPSGERQKPTHNKKLARHSTALITSQPRTSTGMVYDPMLDSSIQGAFWRDNGLGIATSDENGHITKSARSRTLQTNATGIIPPVHESTTPTPRKPKDIDDNWDTWGTPTKPSLAEHMATSHAKSPSSSTSGSDPITTSHAGSRPGSPTITLTPQTLTPQSAPISQRVSIIEPLNGSIDAAISGASEVSSMASKRSSGVWATNFSKMAPVEHLKRTASQIMADWDRAVANEGKDSSSAPPQA